MCSDNCFYIFFTFFDVKTVPGLVAVKWRWFQNEGTINTPDEFHSVKLEGLERGVVNKSIFRGMERKEGKAENGKAGEGKCISPSHFHSNLSLYIPGGIWTPTVLIFSALYL